MKKLNITKEQFNKSNYFQTKYGKLEYVSESGKVYKTNKGHVIKFNEDINSGDEESNFSDIKLEEDGFAKANSDGKYLWDDESSWLPSSGEKVQFYTEQNRCMYPAMVLSSWIDGNNPDTYHLKWWDKDVTNYRNVLLGKDKKEYDDLFKIIPTYENIRNDTEMLASDTMPTYGDEK